MVERGLLFAQGVPGVSFTTVYTGTFHKGSHHLEKMRPLCLVPLLITPVASGDVFPSVHDIRTPSALLANDVVVRRIVLDRS